MNAIYVADDVVLRVSQPTAEPVAAIELHEALRRHDIPVPRPARPDALAIGSFAVTCWERLTPVPVPIDWESVGRAVRRLHQLGDAFVPSSYPVVSPHELAWWQFDRMLHDVGHLLDPAARAGIDAALKRSRGWEAWERPPSAVVCHGDVHPGNVMMTESGPILLDWDLLCRAPVGWDHAPLMTWSERWGGAPDVYEAFAAGYGRDLRDDPVAAGYAELRLVAATLMRLRAGERDPAAQLEAQRRLAYWRGDPDAPPWHAQ